MATGIQSREGIAESGLRITRNFSIATGAIALAGAVVFPTAETFTRLFSYSAVFALATGGLHQVIKGNRLNSTPA
jgi:hypothetical protein